MTHSCQVLRINREAHGFRKFFRISHELDKSQGFSRNSRLNCTDMQYCTYLSFSPCCQYLFSLRLDAVKQCLTLSHSFVVSNLIYPRAAKYFSDCSQLSSLSENSIEKFSLKQQQIYFIFETFMTSICQKKNLAEVRLIHAEQMSLYNFIVLRKKHQTQLKTEQLKQDFSN